MKLQSSIITTKNAEDQSTARILFILILISVAVFFIVGIASLYWNEWKLTLVSGAVIALQLVPFYLLRRQHLQACSLFIVISMLFIVTVIATVGQGIRDVALVAYPIIFVFAGLTLNRKYFGLCVLLTMAGIGWLVLGHAMGWFVPQPFRGNPNWMDFAIAGVIMLVAALVVDILSTKMRVGLTKSKVSEKKYEELFEKSPMAMFRSRIDGSRFIEVNQELCKMSGYSREELLNQEVTDFWDQPAQRAEMIRLLQKQGLIEKYDLDLVDKSGNIRNCLGNFKIYPETAYLEGSLIDITERKKAEEALRKSEALYRDTFDSAPIGIFHSTEDGKFLLANLTQAQMLGYDSAEELISIVNRTSVSEALYIDPKKRAIKIGELKSNNGWVAYDNEYRRKDGSILTAKLLVRFVKKPDGQIDHIEGMLEDVTQRRRAEEALRVSEERHRSILETAMDGYWLADTKGTLLEVNESYCRMSGYTRQELLSMPLPALEAETPIEVTIARIQKIMQQGQDRFETRHRRKDGSSFDVEVSVQYQPNEGGRMVAFLRDITERKKTQTELKDNAERLSRILEATSSGVWDWNIQTGKAIFSPRYARMLGYEPDEFARHYDEWGAIVHPDDIEPVKQEHQDHFVKNKEFSIEFRMKEKSGNWHWIHSRGLLIERDNQGLPLRMVGTHFDIQERKQSEVKLERAYQKEKHQREELEAEAKARGMFIEILGHELRTPLTPLTACSGMLAEVYSGQERGIEKKLVENICKGTNSLAQRLEELLDLAQFSRGTFTLHPQPVNITDLINKTVAQFKPLAEQQSKHFVLEIQEDLPVIEADPSRLQKVLDNLVSNAIKYSPTNTSVTLKTRRTASDLLIEVQDQGIGVSPKEQKQIFDPYHRVQQDTQKYPGIGLGLAVSKQIVEAQGGKIWVESQLARGSSFIVQLPITPEPGGSQ